MSGFKFKQRPWVVEKLHENLYNFNENISLGTHHYNFIMIKSYWKIYVLLD